MRGERGDDLDLSVASDEVEAVRRNEAVERRERERPPEVGDERLDRDGREPCLDGLVVPLERPPIAIDRDDPPARTEQVRERKRERALPGTDVRPRPAGSHGRPQQRDVVGVVHAPSRCSAGRPPRR